MTLFAQMDSSNVQCLNEKFGTHVSNLYFSYHDKPSDEFEAKSFHTQLKLQDPDNVFTPRTRSIAILPSTIHAALTHERILLEGERVMERVTDMFFGKRHAALSLHMNRTKTQLTSEISKINELIRTYRKSERAKYEVLLKNSVACLKEKLADTLTRAIESACINRQNDMEKYMKYMLTIELEKLKKKCCVKIEKALNEQQIQLMRLMPFVIDNETTEIKEMMDTELQRQEMGLKKTLQDERKEMSAQLREIEHFHTTDILETIVTERLECWLSNQVNKSQKEVESDHSVIRNKLELEKLQRIICEKDCKIEGLKRQTESLTKEMKFLLARHLNEPPSQIEHMFPQSEVKCSSQTALENTRT